MAKRLTPTKQLNVYKKKTLIGQAVSYNDEVHQRVANKHIALANT
jgi:hypothetical protein